MTEPGTIAVTGAGRGIGAAIASELARRGHTVACLTRSGAGPDLHPEEGELAQRLLTYRCDVTSSGTIASAFAAIAERQGPLTGLVNNAGLHLDGESASFSTGDFERTLATNATGLFAACREAYPHLVAAGGGLIVNLGSFFDKLGVPRNTAYSASKAAVGAITRCLAVEWAQDGIRVVNVAPGYIETDLNREFLQRENVRAFLGRRIPTGRTGTPEEVARLVAALFDEALDSMTGETIYIDGGHGMAH